MYHLMGSKSEFEIPKPDLCSHLINAAKALGHFDNSNRGGEVCRVMTVIYRHAVLPLWMFGESAPPPVNHSEG